MLNFGDRIVRFLVGKVLIGVGLIAAIISILLIADVAIIASICVLIIGCILALEAA